MSGARRILRMATGDGIAVARLKLFAGQRKRGLASSRSKTRRGASLFACALAAALTLAVQPAAAASHAAPSTKKPPAPPPPTATPAPPPDTRPYDPQLMRLSEILGALTYLRGVCGAGDADQWRTRMQTLLDAEGKPDARRDRLAGAYNHGMQGYALSYRTCTANARVVIERFLGEGAALARQVENRYRSS